MGLYLGSTHIYQPPLPRLAQYTTDFFSALLYPALQCAKS
ncbi:hypothetical protein F0726_01000 [Acidithiobacillus caldus]|nr:hypothetical protein F0726_01000 [Acidithiobacillus caldus]